MTAVLKKVCVHQMSGDIKEDLMLDETKPMHMLFDDIKEQASAALKGKMDGATGAMLILYNGQQLATSSSNAPKELKALRDMPCWPREPDTEHVPTLQLYIPKQYVDVDKSGSGGAGTAAPAKKECCTIL
eukprot:TRINITY_DN2003_c0_g1_i1.p2 TRINITY_DN2003_c0_g1~~TRINITY_DN2003_c0_g1_i1.p2  ORF type:complete len:130 (+),score=46.21 TRINITY_DN2003_c0_g1_i1:398-787(+)